MITLDLSATFRDTENKTPFGTYDNDASFQTDADRIHKIII